MIRHKLPKKIQLAVDFFSLFDNKYLRFLIPKKYLVVIENEKQHHLLLNPYNFWDTMYEAQPEKHVEVPVYNINFFDDDMSQVDERIRKFSKSAKNLFNEVGDFKKKISK